MVGLGNSDITPDALGPKTAKDIFSTRHITKSLAEEVGLPSLRPVSSASPGVLGQTGIESAEMIRGIMNETSPDAVITVDALSARSIKRLGCTVQMTNTGIVPGSGVGNHRAEISRKTLGVPVIAIGVPTVVDAAALVFDITGNENIPQPERERAENDGDTARNRRYDKPCVTPFGSCDKFRSATRYGYENSSFSRITSEKRAYNLTKVICAAV